MLPHDQIHFVELLNAIQFLSINYGTLVNINYGTLVERHLRRPRTHPRMFPCPYASPRSNPFCLTAECHPISFDQLWNIGQYQLWNIGRETFSDMCKLVGWGECIVKAFTQSERIYFVCLGALLTRGEFSQQSDERIRSNLFLETPLFVTSATGSIDQLFSSSFLNCLSSVLIDEPKPL